MIKFEFRTIAPGVDERWEKVRLEVGKLKWRWYGTTPGKR